MVRLLFISYCMAQEDEHEEDIIFQGACFSHAGGRMVCTRGWGDFHPSRLDAGLGLGFQYVIYKGFFVQIAAHVNVRERQSLIIEGEQYTVPGIDYSPGLRLGYRF